MNKLELYTTKGCHACHIMKRLCSKVGDSNNITLDVFDIDELQPEKRKDFKDFPTTIFSIDNVEKFRLIGTYPIEYIEKCINNALVSK